MEAIDKSTEIMNCTEEKCEGTIDLKKDVWLQTGCHTSSPAHPCTVCGRLHFYYEMESKVYGVENRQEMKVFLIGEKIDLRK